MDWRVSVVNYGTTIDVCENRIDLKRPGDFRNDKLQIDFNLILLLANVNNENIVHNVLPPVSGRQDLNH